MATNTWDLALTELIYYLLSAIPMAYLVWAYRQMALVGWLFMSIFVVLQITGSAMVVSAGKEDNPSTIASILISVGLSPLLAGVADIIYGWAKAKGYYTTGKSKRWATSVVGLYHLGLITAIAIYATGASKSANPATHADGQTMAEAGILLLLLLLVIQVAMFIFLMVTGGTQPLRPLLFAVAVSLLLLTIRLLYQCVAVFQSYDPKFNSITGSIVLRVIFQFLPGALILLALVIGGVISARRQEDVYKAVGTEIPLRSQGSGNSDV